MSDVNSVRDTVGIKGGVVSEEGQCHLNLMRDLRSHLGSVY